MNVSTDGMEVIVPYSRFCAACAKRAGRIERYVDQYSIILPMAIA